MARRRWLGFWQSASVLAGCASEAGARRRASAEFENVRDAMAASPSARDAVQVQCQADCSASRRTSGR